LWGFQYPWLLRLNAWWMVLTAFLLTQGDVEPVAEAPGVLRRLTLVCATLASSMLLYGTADWWVALFEGWHSASSDPWVQQTVPRLWFPLLYGLSTVLAMIVLRRPISRALGSQASTGCSARRG
jgi:hypothetical protein